MDIVALPTASIFLPADLLAAIAFVAAKHGARLAIWMRRNAHNPHGLPANGTRRTNTSRSVHGGFPKAKTSSQRLGFDHCFRPPYFRVRPVAAFDSFIG